MCLSIGGHIVIRWCGKMKIIVHLKIVLIAILIGSAFALPFYLDWQSNRNYIKARFNIVDEDDMNKTQALGLKLIDNWGSSKVIFVFTLLSIFSFTTIESFYGITKPIKTDGEKE